MEPSNPKNGKGYKKLSCDRYQACLDLAAKKAWKAFNCEGCAHCETYSKDKRITVELLENTKLCSCGKPTIRPNSKLCASCMGKLAHKTKKLSEKAIKPAKTKTEGYKPQKSTKPAQRQADGACTVNFGEYASVLSEIENLAKEEVRPLNHQIIHMLKEQLKIKNLPKGTTPT